MALITSDCVPFREDWSETLGQMRSWYDLALRQAGYEMEAMELVRLQVRLPHLCGPLTHGFAGDDDGDDGSGGGGDSGAADDDGPASCGCLLISQSLTAAHSIRPVQLREATTWLSKVRGRLAALDLASRPRGGAKAFLKHKKLDLRVRSMISNASMCACEEHRRKNGGFTVEMHAVKLGFAFIDSIHDRIKVQSRMQPWSPEVAYRQEEMEEDQARSELPKLYGAVSDRKIAKRKYQLAKGALDYITQPSNSLQALQIVEPAETEDRITDATKDFEQAKLDLEEARGASKSAGHAKRRLIAARKKKAVLNHYINTLQESGGDAYDVSRPAVNYDSARSMALRLLRQNEWQLQHQLKVTDEVSAWYRASKEGNFEARGAIRILNKMIKRVKAPGDMDDEGTDVLRLTAAIIGGLGRAKGVLATVRIIVPVYATAEHLIVKMVEENWPNLTPEVAAFLQVVFDSATIGGGDTLVEHGVVSGDSLQILMPPNTTLPEASDKDMGTRTGFTNGTAEGLHDGIAAMKQRLHDITATIIGDQWAVTCEFYVRRELSAVQGCMSQLETLHDTIETSDVDEAHLPSVQKELREKRERIAKIEDSLRDDWTWAPGLADMARAAQEEHRQKLLDEISNPSESTAPEDWRLRERRVMELDHEVREYLESTLDDQQQRLWQAENKALADCGGGHAEEVEARVVIARAQQGKQANLLNQARGEYEALWEGAAAPGECCYSSDLAKDHADTAWNRWQRIREQSMEEEEKQRDQARMAIISKNGIDALGPPNPAATAGRSAAYRPMSADGRDMPASSSTALVVGGQIAPSAAPRAARRADPEDISLTQIMEGDSTIALVRGSTAALQIVRADLLGSADLAARYAHTEEPPPVSARSPCSKCRLSSKRMALITPGLWGTSGVAACDQRDGVDGAVRGGRADRAAGEDRDQARHAERCPARDPARSAVAGEGRSGRRGGEGGRRHGECRRPHSSAQGHPPQPQHTARSAEPCHASRPVHPQMQLFDGSYQNTTGDHCIGAGGAAGDAFGSVRPAAARFSRRVPVRRPAAQVRPRQRQQRQRSVAAACPAEGWGRLGVGMVCGGCGTRRLCVIIVAMRGVISKDKSTPCEPGS